MEVVQKFEQRDRAVIIDSVMRAKNEVINKAHSFENQGHQHPISLFCTSVKGVEQHQPQELKHQNTTVHPAWSMLIVSVIKSSQGVLKCKRKAQEQGVLREDLEAILDLKVKERLVLTASGIYSEISSF